MKIYTLKREQFIRRSSRELFEFFEKPENLEKITPSSVGFRIMTPKPITMKTGTVLDYTIRLFGIPIRWTTLITNYDPPHGFTDVSLRGPYSFWHHTHSFEEYNNGTKMIDEVRYALPFGVIGRIIHSLQVKRQLDYIFNYRAQVISDILETNKVKTDLLDNNQTNSGKSNK